MASRRDSIRWVPATGAATALTDLAAGGVDFVSCSMPEAEALIKAGRMRSLVFMSPKRAANFPDVPTTEEALGHKWHKGVWRGFAAPKGLPPRRSPRSTRPRSRRSGTARSFKEFMTKRGFDVVYMDSAKFARVHEDGQRGQRRDAEVAGVGEVGRRACVMRAANRSDIRSATRSEPVVKNPHAVIFAISIRSLRTKWSRT